LSVVYTTSEIFPSTEQVLAINQLLAQILKKECKNWCARQTEVKEANSDLEKIGFKYLDSGLHRVCYVSSDNRFVLKIDLVSTQNKYEIEASQRIPKILQSVVLLPIAFSSDFLWLVMPKAKTDKDLPIEKIHKLEDEICKFLSENGYFCEDVHHGNVGLFEDRAVIFDYGFNIGKRGE